MPLRSVLKRNVAELHKEEEIGKAVWEHFALGQAAAGKERGLIRVADSGGLLVAQ